MNEELKDLLRSVLKEELQPIHEQLEKVDKRFEQVDLRFEQIDKRFDEVDRRFEQVDLRFEKVETRLEAIEGNVSSLKDNLINGLGPYFEKITDHIDEVKEITKNQQIVIDTLCVRSIQHESEINEIKKILQTQTSKA